MNICFINSVLRTPTNGRIPQAKTIRGTFAYSVALSFQANGHRVTLATSEDFRPAAPESHELEVVFFPSALGALFPPAYIPFHPTLPGFLLRRRRDFDLVISSECFQLNSLMASLLCREKLVIWHELALHQRKLGGLPSRLWYNVALRTVMAGVRVIPRSERARRFIGRYASNVSAEHVTHGVDAGIFQPSQEREDRFVMIARLTAEKRVDRAISVFARLVRRPGFAGHRLVLFGAGEEEAALRSLARDLGVADRVEFRGRQPQETVAAALARSQGLLVATIRDNVLFCISEAVCCGVPVLTTSVPDNAETVRAHDLGIVKDDWDEEDLATLVREGERFRRNCLAFGPRLDFRCLARRFVDLCARRDNASAAVPAAGDAA